MGALQSNQMYSESRDIVGGIGIWCSCSFIVLTVSISSISVSSEIPTRNYGTVGLLNVLITQTLEYKPSHVGWFICI